jgi:hypothetical protein
VYYKKAGASEPATYQWQFNESAYNNLIIVTVVNADATQTDADAGNVDTEFDTTHAAPSVTVVNADSLGLISLSVEGNNGGITPPSGHTELEETSGYNLGVAVKDALLSAGSYSPGTWTITQTKNKTAFTVSVKKESAAANKVPVMDHHYRQQRT